MKRNHRILIAPLLAMVLLATGCPKSPYDASMDGSAKVTAGVTTAIDAVENLFKDNSIDRDERDAYLLFFMDLTSVNTDFRARARELKAQGVSSPTGYVALADAAVAAFDTSAGKRTLHVKNRAAQDRLDIEVRAVRTLINGISLMVATAKGA